MSTSSLLPIPVVLPILGAVLAPLLTRLHRRAALVVGAVAMCLTTGVLCLLATSVYAGHGHVVAGYLSAEGPFDGKALGIALAADPFGMTFALLVGSVGTLLIVSALSELGELGPRELGALACLMQLLLAALIGAALTADTINLFVWFEVAALASYGLTGFFLRQAEALEATFKVLVLTSIAAFIVFVGAAVLYAALGALNFGQLHHALSAPAGSATRLALGLLVAGFATKAGLVPFHTWLPDAHAQGPGAVNALFSALMTGLGIVALARVARQLVDTGSLPHLLPLLMTMGLVSALLGAVMSLVQDDLKRLLAWDTVSQAGILVVGFSSDTVEGVAGAVYHMINHGLFKRCCSCVPVPSCTARGWAVSHRWARWPAACPFKRSDSRSG